MPIKDSATDPCRYCNVCHQADAYDFFKFPPAKEILRKLKERYDALPQDEQLYRMENWAVRRGLRKGSTTEMVADQKKPVGGKVVMCGYDKLVQADIWLRKLEETELEGPKPDPSLPF